MNTQTLDLNKMGLVPMQFGEMQEVDGGLWSMNNIVAFGAVVIGSAGVVAGVMTANPALIWGGAELTAGGLGAIN